MKPKVAAKDTDPNRRIHVQEKSVCLNCGAEIASNAKFCRNCGKEMSMTEELITADNVSKELLKSIFEAAFMDVSLDKDGDIVLKEGITMFVFPNKEKNLIKLVASFGLKPTASLLAKLECINKINKDYIMVSAFIVDDSLRCTYDFSLKGGLLTKAFVPQVKFFAQIVRSAVSDYGQDLLN